MTLVRTNDLLKKAMKDGYGVAGLKAWDVRTVKNLIDAAEEVKSPVTILMTDADFKNKDNPDNREFEFTVEIAVDMIKKAKVPISLHYEEFAPFKKSYNAIKMGFNSFILDASEYDYEKNVKTIKEMSDIFHRFGCCIEPQLGRIPNSKDGWMVKENFEKNKTNLDQVIDFVNSTSLDILAPNIGNVHSVTHEKITTIDLDLLKKIKDKVDVPMSLHGGSGVSKEDKQKILSIGGIQLFWIGSMNFKIFGDSLEMYLRKYKNENFYNYSAVALTYAYKEYKNFAINNFKLVESINRF